MKESAGERGGPSAPSSSSSAPPTSTGKRPYVRKQPAAGFRNDKNRFANRNNPHDPHSEMIVYNNHQHQSNPSTHSNFCQAMLRISTMHVLQSAGYDAVQKNPLAVLSDCLGRYLEFLAESAKEFAEHSGRSRITAFDVVDGLSELGIELADLKEWFVENGGVPVTAASGADGTAGEDNQATSTAIGATTAAAAAAANRPALPSWKGADPGRVLQDATRKGREEEHLDIYEWRPLPDGFVMPETDEEQDAYAYPEGSDDEEHNSMEATPLTAQSLQENRSRLSRWIPDTRPPHIPDFAPPFPNCALPADLTRADSDDQMNGSVMSPSTDQYDTNTSTPAASTAGLDSAGAPTRTTDIKSAHAELSKLSINTTPPADTDKDGVVPTAADMEADQSEINPYMVVASFQESTQPFSTLYSTIPAKSKQPHISQSAAPSSSTSLSQKSQLLFSDTLLTLLDPTPYPPAFAKRLKQQASLAHAIEQAGEPSDTLFSNPHQSGMIDSLLKHTAPTVIVNKFANPGVSIQDALSPVVPSERIMNGGAQDYYVAQDAFTTGRTTIAPTASRKSSFSSSPLSTVSYPPKEVIPIPLPTLNNGPVTNLSDIPPKPKAGSRKSSLTSSEPTAPAATSLQRSPSMAVAPPPAPVATAGYSAAPINPTILSRIGSNFDPAALLATSGSGKATATSNGISSPRTSAAALVSVAPAYIPPPVNSTVPASSSSLPGSLVTPLSSSNHVAAASAKASTVTTASPKPVAVASTPKQTSTLSTKQQVAPSVPTPKPIPGPISLSDLPLNTPSSTTSVHVKPPATATPTTPSAPKIRFKFSALDAISTGEQDPATASSSSSKREHSHHSSSSSSHHHRSSSLTSTGSSHHKKSKRSSRDYDEEEEEEVDDGFSREKKKKKKSKSKDRDRDRDSHRERERSRDRDRDRDRERDRERDRDRDRDRDTESSSRHKHHKQHKHSSHKSSSSSSLSNGAYAAGSASTSSSAQAPAASAYGYYSAVPGGGVVDDSGEVINCICSNPTLDDGLFMIACDRCEVWFHGRCVGVREGDAVKTWFCQRCTSSGNGR
ncbi:hypothetical protein BG015_010047 [Linnemannia schmuckeri]|uniref:PHD-type domain-containing protein n=1 Tax=Linnemannia schmuckeri TaxID=64567 RepID=A0A9P5RUL3_9FUNG|nr:hypothetical protein BG015_010047 [Linnemannia schmuckeri]